MESYPLQLAYRTQKSIGIFNAAPAYIPLPDFVCPEGNLKCSAYSPCGRFFGWASPEAVTVVDTNSGQTLTTLTIPNVLDLAFSPRGTFLITWERPGKDNSGDATQNLKVWRSVEDDIDPADKRPIGCFVQKSQGGWNLQYTSDELFCARMVANEVQIFESQDFSVVWNKLRMEGLADFAVAPGPTHSLAVFVPVRKGQPAAVKIFAVPDFTAPVSQKTFFKGDKVQLKWNNQGTSLLVLAQTDVDRSNKSYYGETMLYLLGMTGAFDARITLDKEGPIHDVAWSPNSKEFGVVYGYMPAKATIFSHRAVATHSFPIGPRNTIIFSPTGRFALVAGFGNLAGQIDVYDLEKDFAKVCTIESGNPSVCQWSPDGRYILTATTSPRLRVDNGIKLWHLGGTLMYHEDMVELYSVTWRPTDAAGLTAGTLDNDPLAAVPVPHGSAATYMGTLKAPSKQTGVYRPPGARGLATPLHFKREDEGGAAHTISNGTANSYGRGRRVVPGAEPADSASPRLVPGAEPAGDDGSRAFKNKKKRNNKKKDPDAKPNIQDGSESVSPQQGSYGPGPDTNGQTGGQAETGIQNQPRSDTETPRANGIRAAPAAVAPPPRADDGVPVDQATNGPLPEPTEASTEMAQHPQNPLAKKIRSLHKKLRAIEELEMRLAGGEKLECTQLKKIATKDEVQKELESLENLAATGATLPPDVGRGASFKA